MHRTKQTPAVATKGRRRQGQLIRLEGRRSDLLARMENLVKMVGNIEGLLAFYRDEMAEVANLVANGNGRQ